jgi:hypothetical protein
MPRKMIKKNTQSEMESCWKSISLIIREKITRFKKQKNRILLYTRFLSEHLKIFTLHSILKAPTIGGYFSVRIDAECNN